VVDVRVPIEGLPAALDGFSIAQITDVHVGPTIRRDYVQGIVDAVNRLDADIVAITGDLVDGSVPQLREHVAPLARLKARHGVFFVTGNHEYYSGAVPWMQELERLGITVLHNAHAVVEHDGEQLVVAGVSDFSAGHFHDDHASDPARALQGAPALAKNVLLAHQPRTAHAAARAGFDLQVSGHTHGGQFWPWNHFVRLQQPYTAGLHRLDRLWVYVSRGTGYWGPPKRFGAPSEITRLSLRQASA
jgi:predicted MPP superfamily phosphohydrolase